MNQERVLTLGGMEIQPYQLEPFNCWVFDANKPYIEITEPFDREPYAASARRIIANQHKYLERSAEKEVMQLMRDFPQ